MYLAKSFLFLVVGASFSFEATAINKGSRLGRGREHERERGRNLSKGSKMGKGSKGQTGGSPFVVSTVVAGQTDPNIGVEFLNEAEITEEFDVMQTGGGGGGQEEMTLFQGGQRRFFSRPGCVTETRCEGAMTAAVTGTRNDSQGTDVLTVAISDSDGRRRVTYSLAKFSCPSVLQEMLRPTLKSCVFADNKQPCDDDDFIYRVFAMDTSSPAGSIEVSTGNQNDSPRGVAPHELRIEVAMPKKAEAREQTVGKLNGDLYYDNIEVAGSGPDPYRPFVAVWDITCEDRNMAAEMV